MTSKDYIAIAEVLKAYRPWENEAYHNWSNIVEGIATALQRDNRLFDRERFYSACGVA